MNQLIGQIMELEWKMFDQVNNVGGRASCQNDRVTFEIMRASQFETWNDDTLRSYYQDLITAEREGRNLLTEKYGYMMESSSPMEYARIQHLLPVISPDKAQIIAQIAKIQMDWTVEIGEKYPLTSKQGRPVYSSEDTLYSVSIETYMVGELKTYSLETLKRLYAYLADLQAQGKNIAQLTLENTAARYGYSSIEQLEDGLRKKRG